jgi:hypothetical protein
MALEEELTERVLLNAKSEVRWGQGGGADGKRRQFVPFVWEKLSLEAPIRVR